MNARLLVLLMVLTGACREASSEAASAPPGAPCSGCTLDVPSARGPMPLIVVMHGDREQAQDAAARWRTAANARGWAVLSLQCPRERGCTQDSWYLWGGAPQWVYAQVATVAHEIAIDPKQTYLIGWSGGASYIGMNATSWPRGFAAVVFHGGGQPPAGEACPPRALPAYFLVGDRNPAHPATQRLRSYLEQCRQEVTWDLIDGGDHAREEAALDDRKAAQILDWLRARARTPKVSQAERAASTVATERQSGA